MIYFDNDVNAVSLVVRTQKTVKNLEKFSGLQFFEIKALIIGKEYQPVQEALIDTHIEDQED